MNEKENIKIIANHYGYDAQSRQLVEEMAELTQAINKFWRQWHKHLDGALPNYLQLTKEYKDIEEEIADVEVCLEQIKQLLRCDNEEIDSIKRCKIQRQLKRIQGKSTC